MTEHKFCFSTRAEDKGMELRRDGDGCYWMDFSSDPSFRSVGPMDLDEAEARIEAAESGISRKAFEDGARAQK